ncbi:TPA: diacylglycerol kinase family lipid kinase [Streptococcus equi subsp. zooepidemicus]|uniref:diacylglycerol kinase family lipid kinase n=1 Tax=Streptococcus equi TaxID=1336 RepID=UPI00197EB67C|nr:diacylglycerol kinase family lipid kinase [Streptococcus equi]QTR94074.1 Diacylglycerol kinase [Streptococcus equi subsp. zooepidemicus]HEL0579235.1 diacylglycerol kinase family lipid kinase [Streptococcus equi subsp. zooepidemicus]HEL0731117.1 diacylglycerol kinase family lipid kinase [Streptococcus equi subsp. zooepidemicus]HEL0753429.1 diacylglycerol kinase family lipid kinase [Streptococcus equi subsp. zooepidemicus]HEL1030776.1 diacylglycerol kinase family lipid kinase [Streptococcus e
MKKQMRARLIYNPTSGQEIMKKNVAEVLDILEGFGYETSAFQTTAAKHSALKEARRAAKAGFDLLIAAGGDGTINEVVNGIAPLEKRPKMAIIPAGTTNDFARALKVPRGNPVEAAKLIGKNQTIRMDIGRAKKDTYFINIAAAGSLTELTYSVPSQLKTMFGYLAYLAKGVELLPRVSNVPVKITHDHGIFEGEVSMIFAAITNSVGGFEKIAPDAKLDDGMFTLILIKTANLFEIVHLLRLIIDGGKHVTDRRVEYIKTSKITIEPQSDKRMMINLDGEYGGDAPITLENLKNHITFFANTDLISDDALVDQEELEIEEMVKKFAHEVEDLEQGLEE